MSQRIRYGIWGALFGLAFPILATAIELFRLGIPFSFGGIIDLHAQTPLLMIIDTAPVFLGIFAGTIGYVTDKLVAVQAKRQQDLKDTNVLLEARNKELVELNSMMDGLVYTASHDLKTPVVNFKSLIKMLDKVRQRPNSEAMVQDIIIRLDKATDKFQSTISDLLDISRLERDDEKELHWIPVKPVIDSVLEGFTEIVKQKSATIQVDIEEAPEVYFHERNLGSILQNLISNSIKYADKDRPPVISISTKRENNTFVMEVSDNGIGIDLKNKKGKLFKMFTRLSNQAEGSGVGLYIVKRTIEKFNGEIDVESTVGRGSTFRISLQQPEKLWKNSVA